MTQPPTRASLFENDEVGFTPNKKLKKKEERVQIAICNYIRLQYPSVIFTCDLSSGLRLPIWISAMHKKMRSSRGLPDLFIAKEGKYGEGPHYGHYNGLFIEIKKDGTVVKLKNGSLPADKHLREQAAILEQLRNSGYRAEFCVGFDEAKNLIDEYLGG